jgi:hypothetical protein
MKNQFIGIHLDFIGFSASLLCALHCALLPFLLTLTPLMGLKFMDNPAIEYAFIAVSVFIAFPALIHGFRGHHHKPLSLIVVTVGFILIGIGRLPHHEWQEIVLSSLGAIIVAGAHVINWKHIQQSNVRYPECKEHNNCVK